uniref:Integrase catalytic domain-containing protein n=1 Tax=Tanacetum cinerariifolium TaxID=118510 RepID=A0A6L2LC71_TANCI|nr:hypothetical protein [Tanacetum cinerariifolium]
MAILNSKKIKERSKAKGGDGEGLYVVEELIDHLKRNCPKNNRKKSTGYVKKDDQPSSSGSTYDDSEVMMAMSAKALLDWIMDLGCSYHMTPRYIYELKRNLISLGTLEKEGYTIKLQSGKANVINGSKVVLSGPRADNYVYSLDGYAVVGELNACVKENDSLAQVWHKRLGYISETGLQVLEKQWPFGKKSLENQTRRKVKKLKTDNGLEFYNREFEQLCIESGIARHLTVAEMPRQNGLAERMNITLMDKTPMEMWSGHPSDYEMLRIFGCVAYSHARQGKLEPRAVKCVLLGYPEGVKGYILYRLDDESPKIITSRHVVFNESVMYKDTLKDSGAAAMKEEMDSLRKNKTWELVDHPARQKLVSYKWLFKIKEMIEGVQKPRYKVILALTACKDYELEQLDVKTAFLHENLEDVIYMSQPPGYEQDDMLIACKSKVEIGSTKSLLKKKFDMKELGEAKKILGMKIVRDQSRKIMRVSQSRYVSKNLNNFRIDNGKSIQMLLGEHFKLSLKDCPVKNCDLERMSKVPYTNAVGSLMYLMVCMRPDIAYAVC